jgi:hypothetical protein
MSTSAPPDLKAMLSRAATATEWARVIRRCAWCQRVFDEHGVGEVLVAVDDTTIITTDGMCPPCGRRNLARLAARTRRAALHVA